MLNQVAFDVFNELLEGNLFSVDCGISKISIKRTLSIVTIQKISEDDFIKQTQNILALDDIACVDGFSFTIDLTLKIVKSISDFASYLSLKEFANMRK